MVSLFFSQLEPLLFVSTALAAFYQHFWKKYSSNCHTLQ